MDLLEQENQNLREDVANLREGMEKLTSMMNALLASQAQTSVPQPAVTTLEQRILFALPTSTILAPPPGTSRAYPWGCHFYQTKVFNPLLSKSQLRLSRNQLQPQQRPQQQHQQQPRQQNRVQRISHFDPIPMAYAELLPALLDKNLVQTRAPPKVPERLPSGYRPHLSCAFHQGAPGHDVEHCYPLKAEVQKLIQANILSFKGSSPDVQVNLLFGHGTPSVNLVQDCPEAYPVEDNLEEGAS